MAVYKRGYEPYTGRLTPEWSRFLIIARHAYRGMFESRFLVSFLVVCFIYPVVAAVLVYLPHNAAAMAVFDVRKLFPVDGAFFLKFLSWQGTLAFLLTGFMGPGLVAVDLANNALPLYFCRPFSRAEYVVGKMAVLGFVLSAITWVPGLILFAFAAYLEGFAWFTGHLRFAFAVFVGSWLWIVALCLLALAISAWVKWRIAAGALLFGLFFVAAGFGQAINHSMNTDLGHMVNLASIIGAIWAWLLHESAPMPVANAWFSLSAAYAACYWLLRRKLRAYQVERA